MTPRLSRAAFERRKERALRGPEPAATGPIAAQTERVEADECEVVSNPPAYPSAEDGALALRTLCDELNARMAGYAPALMPLLSGVLRGFYQLVPGFPVNDLPVLLRGFPVTPPRTVDELDDLLNRVEDILLLTLPPSRTQPGSTEWPEGKVR